MTYKINDIKWDALQDGGLLLTRRSQRLCREGLRVVHKWTGSYYTMSVIGSAVSTSALNNTKITDYAGNFIYENNALKRILTENGYYEGGNYYFYIKNHLSSNAMTVNRSGSIVQHNHYYPFGLPMGISNN
jgi:hypothetical protein